MHADDESTFVSDYKTIAKKLNISTQLDDDELLEAVRDAIETLGPYVLVLDNADNLTVFGVGREEAVGGEDTAGKMVRNLFAFVPRHSGTVLWTSRDKRISGSLVGAKRAINVARMMDSEAMALLETVGNLKIGEGELDDAAQLLAQLDGLPLAISQAAAYIRRMSITLEEYLSMLATHRTRWKVLQESDFDRHRRPGLSNSMLETWDISMEQIRRENKMAYDILHVLAFLDNQNIPLEIMVKVAALRNGKLTDERRGDESPQSVVSGSNREDDDDEALHAAIRLQEFSFLHLRATGSTSRAYEMHKLVQEATQYALRRRHRREDEAYFSKLALEVITDLFPQRRWELWEECEKYVLHAQRAGEWAELYEGEIEPSGLLNRVAEYMYDRGRWREMEPVNQRDYERRRRRLGEKHPDTIHCMGILAVTCYMQGRYKEAEKILVEALAQQRDILGEKHPHTIRSIALHAMICNAQARYEEAEKMAVEVLALRREVLGEKHIDTIQSISDLVVVNYLQERYEEAEKMAVEVLALRREVLGEKNFDTIQSIAELATIHHSQRRFEEAEKMAVEVLALRHEVLGEKHPNTIHAKSELGMINLSQKRFEEAEKMLVEVLALRRDILGEKHPHTTLAMYNLAIALNKRQRRSEALVMMHECFQLQCEVLGQTHPSTQRSLACLDAWEPDRETALVHMGRMFGRIAHHIRARISK